MTGVASVSLESAAGAAGITPSPSLAGRLRRAAVSAILRGSIVTCVQAPPRNLSLEGPESMRDSEAVTGTVTVQAARGFRVR